MRSILSKYVLFICTFFLCSNSLASSTQVRINKSYCTQATHFKNEDDLKRDLLINAKRIAVNELFGEMISATTSVQDFVFTSDQINTSSVGFVRIDGNPKYYNGSGLTEVCVEINAYSSPIDRQKFKPEEIVRKYCATNSELTTRELKNFARNQVFIEELHAYDSSLKKYTNTQLLRLVKKKRYSDEGFIPETETFCTKGTGLITPIEVVTLINSSVEGFETSRPNEVKTTTDTLDTKVFPFEKSTMGWGVSHGSLLRKRREGEDGWYIYHNAPGEGKTSYFIAPTGILGDWSKYNTLQFDLVSSGGNFYSKGYGSNGDLVLENNGNTITRKIVSASAHGNGWKHYDIPLYNDGKWIFDTLSIDISSFFDNITSFEIRAEFGIGTDESGLDNVELMTSH